MDDGVVGPHQNTVYLSSKSI